VNLGSFLSDDSALIALPDDLLQRIASVLRLRSLTLLRSTCRSLHGRLESVWSDVKDKDKDGQQHSGSRSLPASSQHRGWSLLHHVSVLHGLSVTIDRLLTGGPMVLLLDAGDFLSGSDFSDEALTINPL
jgi:hypothetical protein